LLLSRASDLIPASSILSRQFQALQCITETQKHHPLCHLKTATADLMAMPPLPVGRISRWMTALKTCGSWNGGGTHDRKVPSLKHGFDFIRYTVSGQTSETSKPAWRKSLII
jgi:hypothetical protein